MTAAPRPRELVIIGGTLAAGLLGTIIALGGHGADSQFLETQRHPPGLKPADVERVVRTAPDPLVGSGQGKAATCERRGSGRRVRISVRVHEDGSYLGRYAGGGGGAAEGCCIHLPGTR